VHVWKDDSPTGIQKKMLRMIMCINGIVSEGNEQETLHKSVAKKNLLRTRSNKEGIATFYTYTPNEWQANDQIVVGFWY